MNFLKSKKIIALLVLTLLSFSGISYAKDEGKVFVVTIGSCSGTDQLSLVNNVFVKKGFAPDKRTQPNEGYEYKIISQKGKVLYSYKFIIPNELSLQCSSCSGSIAATTGTTCSDISGGCSATTQLQTKASEEAALAKIDTTFTFIAPYFEDAKSINIYDKAGKLQLEIDVSNTVPKSTKTNTAIYFGIFFIVIALAGGVFIYLKFYKKPKTA